MEFLPASALCNFQRTNNIYWFCFPTTKTSFGLFVKFNNLMYSMLDLSPPTLFPLSLHFQLPVIAHSSAQLSCQTNFEFQPRNDLRSLILPPPHQHCQMECRCHLPFWICRHQNWCPSNNVLTYSLNSNLQTWIWHAFANKLSGDLMTGEFFLNLTKPGGCWPVSCGGYSLKFISLLN